MRKCNNTENVPIMFLTTALKTYEAMKKRAGQRYKNFLIDSVPFICTMFVQIPIMQEH